MTVQRNVATFDSLLPTVVPERDRMFIGPNLRPVTDLDGDQPEGSFNGEAQVVARLEEICSEIFPTIYYDLPLKPEWSLSQDYINNVTPLTSFNSRREADEINFWNLLVGTVPQTPFWPRSNENLDVLDVGCGQAFDAVGLHAYFGGSFYPMPGEHVNYTGIDIDPDEIANARLLHDSRPELRFFTADATDLIPVVATMPPEVMREGFDVVVIRHQNASNLSEVWKAIFSEAWKSLAIGGLLFVTSYTCLEHDIMMDNMLDMGVVPFLSGRNPYAEMPLTSDHTAGILKRDKYVALFWKYF